MGTVSSQKFPRTLYTIKSLQIQNPNKTYSQSKKRRESLPARSSLPLDREYLETRKKKKKGTRDEKNATAGGILISDKQRGKKRGSFGIFPFYPSPHACVIRVESYFGRAQNFEKPFSFFHPSDKRPIRKLNSTFESVSTFEFRGWNVLSRNLRYRNLLQEERNCVRPFESRPGKLGNSKHAKTGGEDWEFVRMDSNSRRIRRHFATLRGKISNFQPRVTFSKRRFRFYSKLQRFKTIVNVY